MCGVRSVAPARDPIIIMSNLRNGHRDRALKREHRARCRSANAPCALCNQAIDYALPAGHREAFQSDHRIPVKARPDLAYLISNLQPSHASCNASRGTRPMMPEPHAEWVVADF